MTKASADLLDTRNTNQAAKETLIILFFIYFRSGSDEDECLFVTNRKPYVKMSRLPGRPNSV